MNDNTKAPLGNTPAFNPAWVPRGEAPGLDNLLELLQNPACHIDGSGRIQHLNAAWQRYHGASCQGASWLGLLAAEDRDLASARLKSALTMGEHRDLECRLTDAAGNARWFMLSLQPSRGRQPAAGCLCSATEIHAQRLREQELAVRANMRTAMLDGSVDCIKFIAPDGRLIHVNRSGCQALGIPEGARFGMPWLSLLPEEIRPAGEAALAQARRGTAARFAGRSELPGQPVRHWDNLLTPITDAENNIHAILCVSRDVTAERLAQLHLEHSEERLAIAAGVGGLGVWDYDLQEDVLECDAAWYRIMGRDPAQPIRSIADFRPFIHPEDVERATEVQQTAAQVARSNGDYGIVFRIIRPNGDIRWVRSAASVLLDGAGRPRRAVGYVVDITDAWRGELALQHANRALEEEKRSLARQSLEDPLTGIPNRRFLDSELARICIQANESQDSVAVAMIDVDYFKSYNDRYGHPQGDETLRKVAQAIQSVARRSDFAARYGGEEFVVVFTGMEDPQPALERLAAAVAALGIPHADSPYGQVTVSCGCAVIRPGEAERLVPQSLLKASDEALYFAKAHGRNRHEVRHLVSL